MPDKGERRSGARGLLFGMLRLKAGYLAIIAALALVGAVLVLFRGD